MHPVGHLSWQTVLLLLGCGILLLTVGGDPHRALTRHEVRAAQPAREMLAGESWIIPTFAGELRVVKPPTTSWAIAAATWLTRSREEWAVRLPANLGGIVIVLLVSALAARWFGGLTPWMVGLMQLTMYYVLLQARLAEADILLAATVCLAMTSFAFGVVPSADGRVCQSRWFPLLFHAAAAGSFLFKGPIGPAFVFGGCIVYLLWQRDRRGLRFLLNPVGIALFFLVVLPWPIAAYRSYAPILEVWKSELLGRAIGEMGRSDSVFSYSWNIPFLLLPWTPAVLVGVIAGWRRGWWQRPMGRFLGAWFLAGLVVISLCAWKHKHYAIPILPPLTLAGASGLLLWANRPRRPSRHRLALAVSSWSAVCGLAAGLILYFEPNGAHAMALLGLPLCLGGLAVLYFDERSRPLPQLSALFTTVFVMILGVQFVVLPHYDSYRSSAELGRRASRSLPKNEPVFLLALGEAQIAYYLPLPLQRIDRRTNIVQELSTATNSVRYAVAPRLVADDLRAVGTVEILDQTDQLRRRETEAHRLTLVRFQHTGKPPSGASAQAERATATDRKTNE